MNRSLPIAVLVISGAIGSPALAQQPGHDGHQQDSAADHPPAGHWMAPAAMAKRRNPIEPSAHSIEQGQRLFQTLCASCHGDTGQGDGSAGANLDTKPANLVTMAPHHRDGDLAWKIAQGRGSMPSWQDTLKPEDIWNIVNYLRVLSKR